MLVETTGHFKTSQVLFIDLGGLTSFCHQLDFSIRLAIRKQSPGAAIILCSDTRYSGEICFNMDELLLHLVR
jgi:carbonic anhydrase